MPELPEVETTLRGISPHLTDCIVADVIVRNSQLRWPVPDDLADQIIGRSILRVSRRAKYLLIHFESGHIILHLGMSGSLRIVARNTEVAPHDHVDILLTSGKTLRYTDPRRFGCLLWHPAHNDCHKLLANLGPEPLSDAFDGDGLFRRSRRRTSSVKIFIMNSDIVVGVGNIYANEALFAAGIRPDRKAGTISRARFGKLAREIKTVLSRAIEKGGTTLQDFVGGDGKPGYFQQELQVYGRAGEACSRCDKVLLEIRLGQRSTVFCRRCQT